MDTNSLRVSEAWEEICYSRDYLKLAPDGKP